MSVLQTDKWLQKWYRTPTKLCEKLEPYFPHVHAKDIHTHLTLNGMYHKPKEDENDFMEWLKEMKIHNHIKKEHQSLMTEWDGPNIPIFIFPSDDTNRKVQREFNGKSGIAFKDKLFLFVSETNSIEEIKALFTHEYNHVCRLFHYEKPEKNYTLLDTMILEGLAENAVRERYGDSLLAPWVSYYSPSELQKCWKRILEPQAEVSIQHRRHQSLLYGIRFYPKMVGYAVGYYLVNRYLEENEKDTKDLLNIDSKEITHDL